MVETPTGGQSSDLIAQEDCAKRFPDDQMVDPARMRGIPSIQLFDDQDMELYCPSSVVFEDDSDGDPMSVYRCDVINWEHGTTRRVMAGY